MVHTQDTLLDSLSMLELRGVSCSVCGGWAEEFLGMRAPWSHGDIDLVYRGAGFAMLDNAIQSLGNVVEEVLQKRFRHKRAFTFHGTLCEIILVEGEDTGPVTWYWGDVAFHWDSPLLASDQIVLQGRSISLVSTANLKRHRDRWRETEPHRWRDPQSLEVPRQT